jgi:TonB family protein
VEPEYPAAARREWLEGLVILEAVVTSSGRVDDIKVMQPIHPVHDESAISAVRQWRYSPATKNGKPVACYVKVTSKFSLDTKPPKPRPPESVVGNWQARGARIWIELGKDNRAYACQITTGDVVTKVHGVVSETADGKSIRWKNDWPADLARRKGANPYLFLRGRMIPVALAWLGVLASVLLVVGLPLQIAGVLRGSITQLMYLPMLAFEIPLGLWLLIKGVAAPAQKQSA